MDTLLHKETQHADAASNSCNVCCGEAAVCTHNAATGAGKAHWGGDSQLHWETAFYKSSQAAPLTQVRL